MNAHDYLAAELLLLLGLLIVASFAVKVSLARTPVPALVGYMVLGVALRAVDDNFLHLSDSTHVVADFFATVGLACLLFRVGLESDLSGLLRQLRPASLIWIGNVAASFGLGYLVAREFLGLEEIASLFVGTALSATSVGVSVGVWRDAKALKKPEGQLLLDVAELDDLSAIILMSLLVGVAPVMAERDNGVPVALLAAPLAWLMLKLALFIGACVMFSRYVEPHLAALLKRVRMPQGAMLSVVGIGFVIAAVASFAGFSVAIGAFFAGLIFSRDPEAVHMDARFASVYALFTPFFFLGVGSRIELGSFDEALVPGLLLLAAGVVGKVLGTMLPALMQMSRRQALLLGVSMVPRSEIAMAVAQAGLAAGCLSGSIFSAIALVAAVTSVASPILVRRMLRGAG